MFHTLTLKAKLVCRDKNIQPQVSTIFLFPEIMHCKSLIIKVHFFYCFFTQSCEEVIIYYYVIIIHTTEVFSHLFDLIVFSQIYKYIYCIYFYAYFIYYYII